MERFFPACAAAALCTLAACATASHSAHQAPADEIAVQIPVAAGSLPGRLFLAAGSGQHPTVVWFHGFPGLPAPMPAATDALRDTGVNVLYVHYRGSWGTPGSFAPDHALEDAAATLARVRAAPDAWRVDPRHIIAGGDSFGSWVALQAAAADPAVACVATALVLDLGRIGRDLHAGQQMREAFGAMFVQIEQDQALGYSLQGGGDGLLAAIIEDSARHDLRASAPALRERAILLIGAADDTLAPIDAHLIPVADALLAAGADVTRVILPGGHELADADYMGRVAEWVHDDCL